MKKILHNDLVTTKLRVSFGWTIRDYILKSTTLEKSICIYNELRKKYPKHKVYVERIPLTINLYAVKLR